MSRRRGRGLARPSAFIGVWRGLQPIHRIGLLVISAAVLWFSSPALAIDTPPDDAAFTQQAAAAFRSKLGAAEVKIIGPLTLDVTVPQGVHRAYLNNIYRVCRLNADQCAAVLASHVDDMATY